MQQRTGIGSTVLGMMNTVRVDEIESVGSLCEVVWQDLAGSDEG
jgi:hypothetical protein